MPLEAGQTRSAGTLASLIGRLIYSILLFGIGAVLAVGGVRLLMLGGSPYYLAAGLAAAASGVAVAIGRWRLGAKIYLALWAVSFVWGLWEGGLNGWALAPRVLSPSVLGLPFLIVALAKGQRTERLVSGATVLASVALIASVAVASHYYPLKGPARSAGIAVAETGDDWRQYGNVVGGTHFSPLDQINRSNVQKLQVAWRIDVPVSSKARGSHEAQPLKVGDHLYLCAPDNKILDLDPETGKTRWTYDPKADLRLVISSKCRGLAYYEVPGAQGQCSKRLFTETNDTKLTAIDALTGQPCPGFGVDGQVDLMVGMKEPTRGYYYPNSAPTLVRGKLVVGGAVIDNEQVGEPSGVVRAFDAVTGKLAWAWDVDNPNYHGEPKPGDLYGLGTPNVWGPTSADEKLGLVYVGTGNATPDYFGGPRSAGSNKYASSIVAIDAETGEARWHVQTTHYDLWDYDVASQPVLFDLKTAKGVVPAVLAPTKRGQLYVLDRRDGTPLFPIVEKPAPQGGAYEKDKLSATQPWSPALPDLSGPEPSESNMWGLTALDQLWCRISFRESRYGGPLTPPGLTWSISHPGNTGGVNWGSAAVDTDRQVAIIPSNQIATRVKLILRSDPSAPHIKGSSRPDLRLPFAQEGTPVLVDVRNLFGSPLSVPCQTPPFGMLTAVDLQTGRILWKRPLGSAKQMGPLGMKSGFPFTVGTPTSGGAMVTRSGLTFIGASRDNAFRAFNSETGELLFETELPGTAGSKPMSYRSRSGRQFVVVSSESSEAAGRGKHRHGELTAFALPAK